MRPTQAAMSILFAPDYRQGSPYQRLLGEALVELGWEIDFLSHYRRVLPLARGIRDAPKAALLHLHWPEAYHPRKGDIWDEFRQRRFPLDLWLATRRVPLVLTAHNLQAHNSDGNQRAFANMRAAVRRAQLVIVHSSAAARLTSERMGIPHSRIAVIPHGDFSVLYPPPIPRDEARRRLGLASPGIALLFGMVEPYKGIEEIVSQWPTRPDVELVVAGRSSSQNYEATITAAIAGRSGITFRPGWLSDDELYLWLCAADVAVFNYRTILTSGAACLARSWGIPILIPERLQTVDLDEPADRVFRFDETSLPDQLDRALGIGSDFASAAEWRSKTAWPAIAQQTARVYGLVRDITPERH